MPKNTNRIYIIYRFYQYTLAQLNLSRMEAFDNLKTCLSLLLERKYFFDKWIGEESLLSILLNEYHLVDVDIRQLYYRNIIQKRKHGSHVDIIINLII